MSQYPTPYVFLDDAFLDDWQQLIKHEILWMQTNRLTYDWSSHHGSIGTNTHQGPTDKEPRTILSASPGSYCCGATGELFLRCWRGYMEGYEEDDYSADQIYTLIRHYFFRRIDLGPQYLKGPCAGLQWFAEQSEWLTVGQTEDPAKMPFGTFLQMDFDGGSGKKGHSVVVLGSGEIEGRKVLHVWSSNVSYSDKWAYSRDQPKGHGYDFFYLDKPKREFYGAWIVP